MDLGWTGFAVQRHNGNMGLLLAMLSIGMGATPAASRAVEDIRVSDDNIVVRFDEAGAAAAAFMLGGPDRIAIDIDGAVPGGRGRVGGVVAAVRQGPRGPGGTRIVFDLISPAVVTGGRFSDEGRKLTLNVRRVAEDRFARATTAGRMRFASRVATPSAIPASATTAITFDRRSIAAVARHRSDATLVDRRRASAPASVTSGSAILVDRRVAPGNGRSAAMVAQATVAVPRGRRTARLPQVQGDPDRPLVVIDAGHGGHDPGAISPHSGLREKDLTLKAAREIRDALLEGGRVRVALTRDRDEFLVLKERYAIARRLGASLFISVHCDSADNPAATGASIYTLSEVASDREAARLAARENKADILAGVDLGRQSADISSILIDLTQRETMNASAGFARLLGREARGVIPLKPNYHRMASLMVLKAPDLPSVLFETGYLSNEADAERLDSVEGRRAIARSVRRAVEVHFARRLATR